MTKAQKAILDAVVLSKGHITADEVYWKVKQQLPSIALGTIYRNLNYLADSKLIRRVIRAEAPDFFEGNTAPHDHVICIQCGEMSDLTIPKLKDFLKAEMDGEIVSFDLTINYICFKCAEKEAHNPNGEK